MTTFTVSEKMRDFYINYCGCETCEMSDFVKYQLRNGAIYVAHKSSSAFAEDMKLTHISPEKIKPLSEEEFKCLNRIFEEDMTIKTQLAETAKVFGNRVYLCD